MQLKKVNPLTKKRMMLLGFLQKLQVSTTTKLKIGRMLENMTDEEAEEKASELLVLLDSCKSEAEVLKKLPVQ